MTDHIQILLHLLQYEKCSIEVQFGAVNAAKIHFGEGQSAKAYSLTPEMWEGIAKVISENTTRTPVECMKMYFQAVAGVSMSSESVAEAYVLAVQKEINKAQASENPSAEIDRIRQSLQAGLDLVNNATTT